MIHQVMTKFAAAAAEPIRPDIRGGVHQYPGAVERGSIQENDLCIVFISLIGLGIQYLDPRCSLLVLIVQDFRHDTPRPNRQLARCTAAGKVADCVLK